MAGVEDKQFVDVAIAPPLRGHPPGALSPLRGTSRALLSISLRSVPSGVVVDGLFPAVVDIEARVFPSEEVGEFFRADEFGVA